MIMANKKRRKKRCQRHQFLPTKSVPFLQDSGSKLFLLKVVFKIVLYVIVFGPEYQGLLKMAPAPSNKNKSSGWMSDMGRSLFGFLSGGPPASSSGNSGNANKKVPPPPSSSSSSSTAKSRSTENHLTKRSRKRSVEIVQYHRRASVIAKVVKEDNFETPRGSIDERFQSCSSLLTPPDLAQKRKETELAATAKKIFAEILNGDEDTSDSDIDPTETAVTTATTMGHENECSDKGVIQEGVDDLIAPPDTSGRDKETEAKQDSQTETVSSPIPVPPPLPPVHLVDLNTSQSHIPEPQEDNVMGRKSKKSRAKIEAPKTEEDQVLSDFVKPSKLPKREVSTRTPVIEPDNVVIESDILLSKSDSGYAENVLHQDVILEEDEVDDASMADVRPKSLDLDEAKQMFVKKFGSTLVPCDHKDFSESDDEESISLTNGVRMREERRREATKNLSSRRSSTDSSEDGFNLNVRDLKNELRDVEEKFRKAMVTNASLDNEKAQLTYQVDLLKDQLEEREEQNALVVRELREKNREFELMKRSYAEAQRAVQLLQAQMDEQARLLSERGMVLIGQEDCDEDESASSAVDENEQDKRTRAIVSSETANILGTLGQGPLDVRIKRLADERDDLQDSVRRLKLDLEEERSRNSKLEKSPFNPEEADWETKKLIDDYKFKMQKAEQDINTLQTNVARMESQVIRYKTAAETSEKSEEELKVERRKLQRELREATTRVEELETTNKHLETRLGKLKTAKSNLLKEL